MDEPAGSQGNLTLENFHPMTRLWLTRRGFVKDEDISLLQEKGGGSLSNAIFVLLHVAPRHLQSAPTTASMSSFYRSRNRHAPNFHIDKAHIKAIGELCEQLSKGLSVDSEHPASDSIQEVISRELALECDVGEAEVAEREDLEASGAYVDNAGVYTLTTEALFAIQETKARRDHTGNREFTIGDRTRQDLLNGRRYKGTLKRNHLSVTIHSSIELTIPVEPAPEEVIVRVEIKPIGQTHPNLWAQETSATEHGSRLAFRVTYKRNAVDESLFITSDKPRDAYKANSFVHWMEGEGVEDIIQRPRQFVVVSKLHQVLPEGIPEAGSFYTDDHATLFRARKFTPTGKDRIDTI